MNKDIVAVIQNLCLGGEQKNFLAILRVFKKAGHRIHIIFENDGDMSIDFKLIAHTHTRLIFPMPSKAKTWPTYFSARRRFCSALVHCFDPKPLVLVSDYYTLWSTQRFVKEHSVTLVSMFQGEFDFSDPHGMIHKWIRYGLISADKLVVSQPLSQAILAAEKQWKDRLQVLNPNINLPKPDPDFDLRKTLSIGEKSKVAIITGRICERKGVFWLLEAFLANSKLYEDWHVVLVGPFDDDPQRVESLQAQDTQNRIHFVGYQENITSWLNGADLFLFPSLLQESFGMAVLEAALMDLPLLSFDSGAVAFLLGPDFPGTVPNQDQEAFMRRWESEDFGDPSAVANRWKEQIGQDAWERSVLRLLD